MTLRLACAMIVCGVCFPATAAPAAPGPTFDMAEVRVAPKAAQSYAANFAIRGGRYEFRHATMLDLISKAYGVKPDKVVGGPNWLELDKFDVIAKFPPGTDAAAMNLMLRALLSERFGLAAHADTRPMPAYLLTAQKKPLLRPSVEATEAAAGACSDETADPAPGEVQVPLVTLECRRMTMAKFAQELGDLRGAWYYVGNNPVVDQTGLPGAWDFRLQYHQREKVAQAGSAVVSLAEGLGRLGLKLEAGAAPMAVLVVDRVNETPTANPADAAKVLPQTPVEFEVADLKATAPDFRGDRMQQQTGNRLTLQGWRLLHLVEKAWNFQDDERVVGAPKFMETDRWDVAAKIPAEMAGAGNENPVDEETTDTMLKALLAERFKLAAHMEERTVSAWTLVAVKPKMKKADPAERTKCTEGAPTLADADARNANPVLGRLLTCRNVSMQYLAGQLQYRASGYIHGDVLDATGLTGGWDFTLSFSKVSQRNGGGAGSAAPEPNGALSVQEAVERQLGLKLELQKRAVPVLVIDHIEAKPTGN